PSCRGAMGLRRYQPRRHQPARSHAMHNHIGEIRLFAGQKFPLSLDAPGDDGGSPVTCYRVTANGTATACTTSPCTVTGLANSVPASLAVLASNDQGAAAQLATPDTLGDPAVALPATPGGGTA